MTTNFFNQKVKLNIIINLTKEKKTIIRMRTKLKITTYHKLGLKD